MIRNPDYIWHGVVFYVEPIPSPDGSEIECGKEFVGMMPCPLIN